MSKTQKFTNARLNAIQALYATEFKDEPIEKTVYDFLNKGVGHQVIIENEKGDERFVPIADADAQLFTNLVKTVKDKKEQIDEIILNSFSQDWDKDRTELLLQNILRTGIAEFFIQPDLDAPIIINEYVAITRSFYEGPEVRVVNAVLDKFITILI